jgi:hypothetical protein
MLFFTPPLSMEAPPVNAHEVPVAPERPQPTAASPRTLLSIAGVSVMYYDAVGSDISKLHDWLEKHGSLDPQTHKVTPATSNWSIGAAVKYAKTGGQPKLLEPDKES